MKNYDVIIGVDVSKLKLDVAVVKPNEMQILMEVCVENQPGAIKKLISKLSKQQELSSVLVAFECTGIYSMHLSYVLTEAGVDFCQISPIEIHRSQGLKRGKSDRSDALMIAHYAITHRHKLKLASLASSSIDLLRVLYTQRNKIVNDIKRYDNNNEYRTFISKAHFKELNKTNQSILKALKKNLITIDAQILELIKSDCSLKSNYDLMQSIPGIGPQTAIYLLIVTKGFSSFDNARQLACYGGVAPFPYQSGSSLRGRNKVHPVADKKLKSLLNMCALTAKKYDPQLAIYYQKKLEEGKHKMLVLNNIRNKLLTRVFAVVKRQQPYVNTFKFAS